MADEGAPSPLTKRARGDNVPEGGRQAELRSVLEGEAVGYVVFETADAVALLAPTPEAFGHCVLVAKPAPWATEDPDPTGPGASSPLAADQAALLHAVTAVTRAPTVRGTPAERPPAAPPAWLPYVDLIPEAGPAAPTDPSDPAALCHRLRAALPPSHLAWPHLLPADASLPEGAVSLRLEDASQTAALGALLARLAQPGDVFALIGDLGAGKTALARGFLREFFANPDLHVPSPTYLLCLSYADDTDPAPEGRRSGAGRSRLPGVLVHHMDPYRLKTEGKLAALVDLETAFRQHISLIEWPQKLGPQLYNDRTPPRLEIEFLGTGPQAQGRRVTIRAAHSARWAEVLRRWRADGAATAPVTPDAALADGVAETDGDGPATDAKHGTEGASLRPRGEPATWRILGIETSCDDTGAAVVQGDGRVLSDVLASQAGIHEAYGGVKPDAAQAAHAANIDAAVEEALTRSGVRPEDLTAVAVTVGPGLALCLEVGVRKALAIAQRYQLPVIPIHHMEAHAMVTRLPAGEGQPPPAQFPALVLLVSGGHNMLVLSQGLGQHKIIGNTLDDSVGEAFDKTARLLGIDAIPGGPRLEKLAATGDPTVYAAHLPLPLSKGHKAAAQSCDFSFAGLKTAVRDLVRTETQRIERDIPEAADREAALQAVRADIAAAFQAVAVRHLVQRLRRAVQWAAGLGAGLRSIVAAGGVAANTAVRREVAAVAAEAGLPLCCPPIRLCTDNGVMVAWTGVERLRLGICDPPPAPGAALAVEVRPRWPLGGRDPRSAPAPGGRYGS